MSQMTNIANTIADQLEGTAKGGRDQRTKAAEDYYAGYVKACEDFAERIRRGEHGPQEGGRANAC